MTATRTRDLQSLLTTADDAYHSAAPIMSDADYDTLRRELVALEQARPELVTPDSPTQLVAGVSTVHAIPMLSLNSVFCQEDFELWLSAFSAVSFVGELKIDGVSLSLTYINGQLHRAATRGQNITDSARLIPGIPQRLDMPHPPAWAEIRGEAFIARPNSRAACAGALRQRVGDPAKLNAIQFVAYTLHANRSDTANQIESLDWLKNAGFYIDPNSVALPSPAAALAYVQQWHTAREALGYPTDGVVIKVASHQSQSEAGETTTAPRWAIAVKGL